MSKTLECPFLTGFGIFLGPVSKGLQAVETPLPKKDE